MLKKIPLQHVKSKEDIHNLTAIWNTLTLLLSSKANNSHIKLEIKKKTNKQLFGSLESLAEMIREGKMVIIIT